MRTLRKNSPGQVEWNGGSIPYRIPQGYGNQIPDFGGSYFKVKSHENYGSVRAVLSTQDTVLVHFYYSGTPGT